MDHGIIHDSHGLQRWTSNSFGDLGNFLSTAVSKAIPRHKWHPG